ncbi:NUDIX hydrolase family protein [Falsarthrobacter nasiphocae]|uniref:ADP-ribose pyrophosphatase YjhB (NUDIX family) n=1 Tax=Falsarthrobacter nasiphocae TaxID=189863 RepID=A0AAE3YEB5_9MICC|nr:NUDIX hydrolase family protein [Falsarthrobacter nasiphocae]MDR6891824.1 ADP-ribose pyrophosphatase YjhB (NUDIX family) [Falsarthrobacter nasiphocae]
MNLRTPDQNPGWMSEDTLFDVRQLVPIVYVEALPVRLDPLGCVSEVGLLFTADGGEMTRAFVSGRVRHRETIRAALLRNLEKDLGPLAMPQLPASTAPYAVAEYFPAPSQSGLTDERQHAVALEYVVPVQGTCTPRQDALELSWLTPDEALTESVLAEFTGGRGELLRQALAHVGWGR